MSSSRATLRTLIALFGLIAVLLGALEHEDLIFQEPLAAVAAEHIPSSLDSLGAQWQAGAADSGTESKFREEIDRDWTASKHAPLVTFIGRTTPRPLDIPARIIARRITSRTLPAGIIALRL
jgi:hypothetical protein